MQRLDRFRRESPGLYWLIVVVFFLVGLWPVGLFLIISGMIRDGRYEERTEEYQDIPEKIRTQPVQRPGKTKKVMKKSLNRFLIAAGGICTAAFALAGLDRLIFRLPDDPLLAFRDSYIPFIFTGLSALMLISGISRSRKAERYRTYLAVLEGRDAAAVSEIAECCPFSKGRVRSDLQDMIDGGFFGESAWIDYSEDYLILTREAGQTFREKKEKARTADKKAEAENGKKDPDGTSDDRTVLEEIRRIGDRIKNPDVRQQSQRIQRIADQILDRRKNLQEENRKLRLFAEYYLPEVRKLLQRYAELEEQEIRGENIRIAMSRIEDVMEKVASGFETQLDDLYQADVMDISSDIAVMEQMLARDGMSDDRLTLRTGGSDTEDRKNQTL